MMGIFLPGIGVLVDDTTVVAVKHERHLGGIGDAAHVGVIIILALTTLQDILAGSTIVLCLTIIAVETGLHLLVERLEIHVIAVEGLLIDNLRRTERLEGDGGIVADEGDDHC